MKINRIVTALLFTGMTSLTSHAATFANNSDDVMYSQAHYKLTIASAALKVNIPGATVTDINAGVEESGTVSGLFAKGTHASDNYEIQLTVDKGDMGTTVVLNNGDTASGIGLYTGSGINDLGGVLENATFNQADGTTLPVSLKTGGGTGCQVTDNKVSFSGTTATCTLEFTGSDIEKVDTNEGAESGSMLYTVGTAKSAGAGHTYSNQVNYIISVASS